MDSSGGGDLWGVGMEMRGILEAGGREWEITPHPRPASPHCHPYSHAMLGGNTPRLKQK